MLREIRKMNKTKYMIANIVYYTGLVGFIGIAIGMFGALAWYIIITMPFMLAIAAGIVVLVGLGLLYGWAEDYIGRYKGYNK